MAKKKTKSGTASTQATNDVIRSLGMVAGRSLIARIWPNEPIIPRAQSVLRIKCPIHDDSNPSMDIDFVKGTIHCYGCNYHTNSIFRFLQDAKGWLFREALEQVRQHATTKLFSDTTTKELDGYDVHQTATRLFGDVCNAHLLNLLSPTSALPEYTDIVRIAASSTVKWLFEERKRNADFASRLPYGIVPPRHIFDKLLLTWFDRDLERRQVLERPLMDKTFKEQVAAKIDEFWQKIDSSFIHAVCFVTGYSLTEPGRIRLRRPNVPKSEALKVLPGFTPDSPNGFFGLYVPHLAGLASTDRQNGLEYYLVEGEMDTLAAMEGVFAAAKTGVIFIASCGTANDIDALSSAGITQIRAVSDEPHDNFGKGDVWVQDRLTTASDVEVSVFSRWETFRQAAPMAKDPDEVIQTLGFRRFYEVVVEGGRTSYRNATEWAIDKIQEEISSKQIESDNARAMTEIAGRYGQCVRHPASQAAFIDKVATLFGVAPGPLRQEIVQARDTEESFRLRITERMRYEYQPLYFEASTRGHVLTMFHKQQIGRASCRERVSSPV